MYIIPPPLLLPLRRWQADVPAFVVKALSLTLTKFPGLNVSLEQGGACPLTFASQYAYTCILCCFCCCCCRAGAKLTYLPFVVKALSLTLTKFPGINVSLEQGGAALLQRASHNIGVAMATSNGLVVPNVKQVGR
jgi:pyruvate/2-oxoglutarate dehydrogenase complex dihydrolipoamide acyltransferase (E2) component